MKHKALATAALAAAGFAACVGAAQAEDFYKGKTVTLTIAAGPGGGFDTIARTLGEYLGRHIPGNPTIQPQNRPGAGGRVAANWLYNLAAKDGTQVAMLGPWTAFEPFWDVPGVKFDPPKFNWLVSANRETSSCVFSKQSGIKTFADMKRPNIRTGSYGPTSAQTQDVYALNALLGTNIKVVHGYKGTKDTMLAVERGELEGTCGIWASSAMSAYAGSIKSGNIRLVVQLGMNDHPDFKGLENPVRAVTNADDRAALALIFGQLEIARPFALPPGTPPDRVAIMRKAFWDTLQDKELIAAAKKRGLDFRPLEGEKVQTFIADLYKTPKAVVARAKKIQGY
ncbi:MAG: Bug family tripartite tricarboxylate transporter substrate binding protein [Beijerinckiaceae bacterium]